jgi:putative ABC transport system permease protein
MGAIVSEVKVMLNKDFVKWVAIVFVIATPIAWCTLPKWLENYANKTEVNWCFLLQSECRLWELHY